LDGTDAEYAKKGRTNYSRRHESYYESKIKRKMNELKERKVTKPRKKREKL